VLVGYVAGIVLPSVTGSPLLLNLHMLRSSTIIHLLAGLAAAALAVNWLRNEKTGSFLPACLIVLALSLDGVAFWFAIPFMLMPRIARTTPESEPSYARPLGYPPRPLPFDAGLRPKPAFFAMRDAFRSAPSRGG
jgi:hypothetical protein